jgi:hypothetical protein
VSGVSFWVVIIIIFRQKNWEIFEKFFVFSNVNLTIFATLWGKKNRQIFCGFSGAELGLVTTALNPRKI